MEFLYLDIQGVIYRPDGQKQKYPDKFLHKKRPCKKYSGRDVEQLSRVNPVAFGIACYITTASRHWSGYPVNTMFWVIKPYTEYLCVNYTAKTPLFQVLVFFRLCIGGKKFYNHIMNTYQTGLFAEWRARMYLRLRGFRIVKSRYITGRHTGRAEIDIIARRKNLMIFVEVKARPTFDAGCAAITARQNVRLRRAAETYITRIGWRGDARFDAIIICGRRIFWLRGEL